MMMRAAFSALPLLLAAVAICPSPLPSQSLNPLESAFRDPPASARPKTWWHWINGNVTRDGITRDLEAMKRAGLAGAAIFDGGVDIPAGPVKYLSPEWQSLMAHAINEGVRLGFEIDMHNGPGWSSSGGPWITPDLSMQQLVWTETTVKGGRTVSVSLPRPYMKEGFYRDAMVLAFPALPGEERPFAQRVARASAGPDLLEIATLTDGDLTTAVNVTPARPLLFEFAVPFQARSLTLTGARGTRAFTVTLEASGDGTAWRRIGTVQMLPPRGIEFPGTLNFTPVSARYYRLTPSRAASIAEAALSTAPRIEDWNFKAEFAFRLPRPSTLPAEPESRFVVRPASVRDISSSMDAQGRLIWKTAPPGAWTILRIGHTATGQHNVAASDSGRGLECDKFSTAAVDRHFNTVIGPVLRSAGFLSPRSFAAVVIDSYEGELQNWTAAMPAEFHKRNGYDIRSYMPALTGRLVASAANSDRFLFDFRATTADLMNRNYYGRMKELCYQQNLKFYVEGYGPGAFDELTVSGLADFPTTEFWSRTPWTDNRVVKMVSSAAHIYGKTVVAAEAFTAEAQTGRWLDYPYAMKALGDLMFSQGFNQAFFHRYAHQPHPDAVPGMTMGPWGFHFERTNTWFAESTPWLDYLARSQYLLRQGSYVADIAYLVEENHPETAQYTRPIIPLGFSYDLINADVLLTRASVHNGRLQLPGGASYRLLVMPDTLKAMTPALLRKLNGLVAAGLTLVGPKPEFPLSLRGAADFERVAAELWKSPRVLAGRSIEDALITLGAARDFDYTARNPGAELAWHHRNLPDGDIYFIANRQRRADDFVCTFRVTGREPELWQAETGTIQRAAIFRVHHGRTVVPLHLGPAESVFVVFRRPAQGGAIEWLSKDGVPIASTSPFPPASPSDAIHDTFTISVWARPDVDLRLMPPESTTARTDETGKNYVVLARDERRSGHANVGLAVGRNGAYLVERSSTSSPAVLVANMPVSGWTHFAVVYHHGKPRLYVNGRLVREGLSSGNTVHPGIDAPPPPHGVSYYFEGNMTRPGLFPEALNDSSIAAIVARGLPPPEDTAPPAELLRRSDGSLAAVVRQAGTYSTSTGLNVKTSVPAPLPVNGPWHVSFASPAAAPPAIQLPTLQSLHLNADPAVRYFSGAATYSRSFEIPGTYLGSARRLYLDLGRVEVIASVTVNGKPLGILWKEPFVLDITSALHEGTNSLEVRVTTLWPNRLIGDEQLPPENEYNRAGAIVRLPDWYAQGKEKPPGGRSTFTTWHFYDKNDPLIESGLLGPVRLVSAVELELK
jgi:hypothetical protein